MNISKIHFGLIQNPAVLTVNSSFQYIFMQRVNPGRGPRVPNEVPLFVCQ